MKTINNKRTEIKITDDNVEVMADYTDLIKMCINYPKINAQGQAIGFDYSDIENRFAISNAIKEAKGKNGEEEKSINLEDSQFKYLLELVKGMKWRFWHEDLLKFKEDIISTK